MTEIELKFQVPAPRRAAVAAAAAGRAGAATVQRLQAAYFDTQDRALAAAGVALRLRREGPRWVQTLKAGGADTLTRLEHNVQRAGRSVLPPPLDLALHDGTPAGQRLAAVLEGRADAALACQYRTDIRRTARTLRARGAVLELAFDAGGIVAGGQRLPVCELEIELLRGTPAALLATARHWVQRYGLWLDTRSKAERGTLLASGQPWSPARKSVAVPLAPGMRFEDARRVVMRACAQQVAVNASQVASGDFADEHVHQLRVGLRRTRAALSLFAVDAQPPPLAEPVAALFRALGAARDRVAVGGPLREQLALALAATGLAIEAPSLRQGVVDDPVDAVRAIAAQTLLLELLAAGLPPPPGHGEGGDGAPLAARIGQRLNRWHRQVARAAARFAQLDDAQRHRLRKRVKRLRYTVEFAQGLYGPRKAARYLRALAALQERLGALNDVSVALAAFHGTSADDAPAVFALGWLAARRDQLAAACTPALERFTRAKRPWKG